MSKNYFKICALNLDLAKLQVTYLEKKSDLKFEYK